MKKEKEGTKSCTLNSLLFPVEIRNEEMASNTEYSKRIVGEINGENFLLNQCSPRYELVKNSDIFPKIEGVLNDNKIEYEADYSHFNHVRFYANYRITDKNYRYTINGTTDTIQPMLRVQHSYNGLTKYRIMLGYFRFVCTNGLVIPVKEMKKFNLVIIGKHTESILHSFEKLNEMLQFFSNAKTAISEITAKYEFLATTKYAGGSMVKDVKDRITEVLNAGKIIAVDQKNFNTVETIFSTVLKEANDNTLGYNGVINDFLIYNGVNQYIFSDRNIVVPEKRIETDSTVLEYLLNSL